MATAPRVRSKEQLLRVLPCMREGLSLEFKKAKNKLPSSFWQSYSAFANTQGGTIILGIEEQNGCFALAQLSRETVDKLIQEFWNNVHNPNTISHCLLEALALEYPDKRRSSNQRYFSVDANKLE